MHILSICLYLWGFICSAVGLSCISIVCGLNFLLSCCPTILYHMLFLVCLAILYLAFQAVLDCHLVLQGTYIWNVYPHVLFLLYTCLGLLWLIDLYVLNMIVLFFVACNLVIVDFGNRTLWMALICHCFQCLLHMWFKFVFHLCLTNLANITYLILSEFKFQIFTESKFLLLSHCYHV